MKNVYIVLSRSKTLVARLVQISTRKKYSHSSLALHKDCATFYSFGRRDPKYMFPAGFITEGVEKRFFKAHPNIPIAVYELPVTDEQYVLIQERLKPFINDPYHYKYSVLNLPLQEIGIDFQRKHKYVCSAFIAYILRGILDMGKPFSLVFPHDYQNIGLVKIYEGPTKDYTSFYNRYLKDKPTKPFPDREETK